MLGIISDTHDNVAAIKKAAEIFRGTNCDLVIHCGDIVAPATIQFFKGLNIKFVRGNCDGDIEMIKQKAAEINAEFFEGIYEFDYDGKKFAAYHGNDKDKLDKLIKSGQYDYVLRGHTHEKQDDNLDYTRVINPGALYPTVKDKTVAVLDVPDDELKFMKTNGVDIYG